MVPPDIVLGRNVDVATRRFTGRCHLSLQFLTDLTALVVQDLDLDRIDLIREILHFFDESVVPSLSDLTGLVDREGLPHQYVL